MSKIDNAPRKKRTIFYMREIAVVLALVAAVGVGCKAEDTCQVQQDLLMRMGHGPPAGYPETETAIPPLLVRRLPAIASARRIPFADNEVFGSDAHLDAEAPGPYMPAPPHRVGPYIYVTADASIPVADLRLDRWAAATEELRLVVEMSDAERVARHVAMFPQTPAALRPKLPSFRYDDDATWAELARLAAGCAELDGVVDIAEIGGGIDLIAETTLDAFQKCRCSLASPAAFVSLMAWAVMPVPRHGWLPLDMKTVEGLRAGATVGDLAEALKPH